MLPGQFQKATIYFFSGTGNARFAAEELARNFQTSDLNCGVINIAERIDEVQNPAENELVGFCYPTHGFNAPPVMLKFISRFPKGRAKVFLLNTRAGMKLYKLHTPGLGGIALWLPALILWFKGYRIIGYRPLDMPSNWISIHPGIREKVILSIKAHCTQTLKKFSERIVAGRKVFAGFVWLPIDLLVFPIAIGYYFYGRFGLSKTFYVNYKCNNCNLCIEKCPVGAIKTVDGRPFWTYKCESCMQCMNICPHRAIETSHTFTFVIWWIAWSLIPVLLPGILVKLNIMPESFYKDHYTLIYNFIQLFVGMGVIFLAYRIFHIFLGNKTFNKIFSFTSLTHIKYWRRYLLDKILKKEKRNIS